MLIALGLAAIAVGMVPVVVTWIERNQAHDLEPREPYEGGADQAAGAVVIYFSRSGNTALAARHIANRMNARLVQLSAPAYELGLVGWSNAMRDARGLAADITPRAMDLSAHDTVYLGSPVWLYSPAPPIWAFAENNRFDGKRVVLFNTFNSTFEEEYIEQFRQVVMDRGADSFEHRFVRRGRMTQQISPESMLTDIDTTWELVEAPGAPQLDEP